MTAGLPTAGDEGPAVVPVARPVTGAGTGAAGAIGKIGAIHQFVPALIPRDATGSHTLLLRQALREAGLRSEIFAEATHDELLAESLPLDQYPREAAAGDVLVYQFSTSSAVVDFLLQRPEPLVLDYHNITRPELSEGWDPEPARRSAEALRQLATLAPRAVLGLADSAYNELDLLAAGCSRTAVVPVLVDLDRLVAPADRRTADRLSALKVSGGADWLFVGRLVPSKAQHQLVKALWAYRRLYDPAARLHLVGPTPSNRYLVALRAFVGDLGLHDAVRITGEVSDAALAAYFEAADLYISMSLHEGFGVPLLEAMRVGLPVLARSAGAVPATVGEAGLLLDRTDPSLVAAAAHRLLTDPELRTRLSVAGQQRVDLHTLAGSGRRAVEAITGAFAGAAGGSDPLAGGAGGGPGRAAGAVGASA
ncbi:MAG TPA: glycosyltransferase family 4 protein [Acidimicrobiales bacterium]|nr:glycosyltransferase family 4 protein [Acidimicrobiales bacterium]